MSESVTLADGGKYTGPCKDGHPHGNGTCQWPDGSTYKGEWRSGKMHGKGEGIIAAIVLQHYHQNHVSVSARRNFLYYGMISFFVEQVISNVVHIATGHELMRTNSQVRA